MKYPAPGLEGGGEGSRGEVLLNGERLERFVPIPWHPGDEIVLRVPGGGGFGEPRQRERERVLDDVALGLVSLEAAREVYGLEAAEVDPEALRLEAIRRYLRPAETNG